MPGALGKPPSTLFPSTPSRFVASLDILEHLCYNENLLTPMPYDRDRFAFWHRWVQNCITAFHREYVPHGELHRLARLGPIPREAVFERFKKRPPAYSTRRSLHRALRRAVKYVAHRRPRADAIIITLEEVYILKVKRHPTQADIQRLEEYAALFPHSPEHRAHAHKPVHLILVAHQLDDHLPRQAQAAGVQLLLADHNARLYPP